MVARLEAGDPALYPCQITHVRTAGPRRAFTYRSYLWLVDLDRLPAIPRPWRPLASFRVKDHLGRAEGPSIRSNIDGYLADHGIDLGGGRVLMLASAATFGYVFNPLSVFWCFDAEGAIVAVLAEVHNTYRQRHVYLLHPDPGGRAGTRKDFHVSPFLPMHGSYRMRLPEPGQSLRLSVTLMIDGSPLLAATVRGRRRPFTLSRLAAYSARFPLVPARVSLLIRWQGIRLLARRVPLTPRPTR
ncbi:MAG TPA: DUF1365 domain-containing protein [Streptosporangiaceae bacterium]|nr:DUF1365 domain-containing protein [Streptosporangiaceae bacterium]